MIFVCIFDCFCNGVGKRRFDLEKPEHEIEHEIERPVGAISRSRWQTDEKALGVADRRTRRCGPLVVWGKGTGK